MSAKVWVRDVGKYVEEALGACGRLGVGRRRRVALTAARTLRHLDERDVAVAEVVQVRGQGAQRGAFHRQLQDTVDRGVTRAGERDAAMAQVVQHRRRDMPAEREDDGVAGDAGHASHDLVLIATLRQDEQDAARVLAQVLRETVEHADGKRVTERVEQSPLGEDTDDAGASLSQGRGERGSGLPESRSSAASRTRSCVASASHRPPRPGGWQFCAGTHRCGTG